MPPAGDRANFVISGTFVAVGTSQPFYAYGPFNVAMWGSNNTTLTVSSNGATTGAVTSATGLVNGMTINSTLVPPGTRFTISSTTATWQLPVGYTTANVFAGADTAALFTPTVFSGTIAVERSFDGGSTWLVVGIGGNGFGAIYTGANQATLNPLAPSGFVTPVDISLGEPEAGMLYRLNCLVYASGTINYRMSGTGAAATVWTPFQGVPR